MLACADDLDAAGRREARRRSAHRRRRRAPARRPRRRGGSSARLARPRSRGAVARQATALRRALAGGRRGAFAAVLAGWRRWAPGKGFEDPRCARTPSGRASGWRGSGWPGPADRAGPDGLGLGRTVAGGRRAHGPLSPDRTPCRGRGSGAALVEFVRRGRAVAVADHRERVTLRRLGPSRPSPRPPSVSGTACAGRTCSTAGSPNPPRRPRAGTAALRPAARPSARAAWRPIR